MSERDKKINEIEKILKDSLIFKNISEEKIKEYLNKIKYEIKLYKKNSNIVFRGDKVEGLNIILKGSVSAEMLTKEGNIKKIENLEQFEVLASAFIFGEKNNYPVDLIANEEVKILNINKENFLKLLSLENIILENFLNEISNKTQFLSAKIWTNFNNKTIKEKISNFIINNQSSGEIVINNLRDLAEKFGIARPSLSRVLAIYVNENKLERIGRNKYRILDIDFFTD